MPSGDLPNSGIKPRSPALQADSLLPKPPGKPMHTGVGSYPFSRDLPNPGITRGIVFVYNLHLSFRVF